MFVLNNRKQRRCRSDRPYYYMLAASYIYSESWDAVCNISYRDGVSVAMESSVMGKDRSSSSSDSSTVPLILSTSLKSSLTSGLFSGDLSQHFIATCSNRTLPELALLWTAISVSNISAVHSSRTALWTQLQRSAPVTPGGAECEEILPVTKIIVCT